ncbi:hypothetical protein C8P66_13112 [Humitalea rosea]|uniref:PXPV repeat-containing protein n=1 Tax=Humitalea rosea TaxID=990373 RepID=A0A2W7HYG1_9PROT|nr:hypothetical protein [Humitalea rosea]PZW38979.1 hypothetical protein C8P66_13112 [Humitalea rosea]
MIRALPRVAAVAALGLGLAGCVAYVDPYDGGYGGPVYAPPPQVYVAPPPVYYAPPPRPYYYRPGPPTWRGRPGYGPYRPRGGW